MLLFLPCAAFLHYIAECNSFTVYRTGGRTSYFRIYAAYDGMKHVSVFVILTASLAFMHVLNAWLALAEGILTLSISSLMISIWSIHSS
jgi:hypothetical protein